MLTLFLSLFWFKVGRSSTHRTMNTDFEGNEQTLDSWLFVLFKCATHPECWWKFNETWRRSYLSSTQPQYKAATAYCLSWTKAQFKRMSKNPEVYSTNQTEFLIAHFGWKDEERMICMFSQKNLLRGGRKMALVCFFFSVSSVCLSWTKELWILSHLLEAEVKKIKGLICPLTFTFTFTRLIGALTFTFYFCSKQTTSLVPSSSVPSKLS